VEKNWNMPPPCSLSAKVAVTGIRSLALGSWLPSAASQSSEHCQPFFLQIGELGRFLRVTGTFRGGIKNRDALYLARNIITSAFINNSLFYKPNYANGIFISQSNRYKSC
jgi:hypothetical protein